MRTCFTAATGVAAAAFALAMVATPLHRQVAVRNQGYLPFSEAPIRYRDPVDDPVARLQARLDRGEVTLDHEPAHGYLRSVLDRLGIPLSSQTLVFSKTSVQYRHISPQLPRALYFNDDVYVGQVHDGKVLEFVSFDARQGAVFYILDEQPAARPTFQRAELDCTQCHVAAATRGVPGVLVRSILANPTGTQAAQAAAFVTGHQSPLSERFGGWYVTGTHGRRTQMGNVVSRDKARPEDIDRAADANLTDLAGRIDAARYLTPHSDIVAQLVQGAGVTLTNEATNAERTTATNEVGEYSFANVLPGSYTLSISLAGFRTEERRGLRIGTQQSVIQDVALEIGSIAEQITATGETPLVERSGGTVATRCRATHCRRCRSSAATRAARRSPPPASCSRATRSSSATRTRPTPRSCRSAAAGAAATAS